MEIVNQSFTLSYDYPVIFTEGVFDPVNPVFRRVVSRLEPDRRHRLFFVIDENVSRAQPRLRTRIAACAEARPQNWNSSASPWRSSGAKPSRRISAMS